MQADRPSRTAEGAALLRAMHVYVDEAPHLFDDRAVAPLLSGPVRLALRPVPLPVKRGLRRQERRQPMRAAMRGQIVLRARYAEDALERAVAAGVDQVVILAAGLDTTALRRTVDLPGATFWEVDHPATQRWKRRRLGARATAAQRFVPVVFGEDDLAYALLDAGIDPARPIFVNWLGCTYYLPEAAASQTLAALAAVAAPGSRVVLDYWTETTVFDLASRMLLRGAQVALALGREPLVGLTSSQRMCDLARTAGWNVEEDLDAAAQRARWLRGRQDALAVPGFAGLATLVNTGASNA